MGVVQGQSLLASLISHSRFPPESQGSKTSVGFYCMNNTDCPMEERCYWVYILLCSNNTYYTGYTHNLIKRYQSHLKGTGKCKYTRSFKPIAMAQCWNIRGDKALAMQIERHIKTLSRVKKQSIISDPTTLIAKASIQPIIKDELILINQLNKTMAE